MQRSEPLVGSFNGRPQSAAGVAHDTGSPPPPTTGTLAAAMDAELLKFIATSHYRNPAQI
jgi:hypothetical protein